MRAVVFDLDGVLVDSFAVMREAFAVAYAEAVGDGPPPFTEYVKHQGRFFPDIMRLMGLPLTMQAPFVRESERLASRVTVYDGVVDLLVGLRARGLCSAVATGKSGGRARSLLGTVGLLPLLDGVVGSDEVRRPKPAPDIVLSALALVGVEATEAVMVGDAPTDILSARAAGVTSIAALWAGTDEQAVLSAAPDHVIRQPPELLELLQGCDERSIR
ncbi:HAD-IA family hydrolase [Kitasatospora sp. MAP5-34]|uniref:HAD-IA family hydrolase n=1 Tax=Kitasatospora sp. MAP5-34 TaxID=3035102 RepID=UPI002473E26E|nr:HAD-IA family hydrolase [Kitasatospora sp. MAP5-34]MDH6579692.1 AHBA synthesis associated protein [Kitasatospora sp. MAP5-34]